MSKILIEDIIKNMIFIAFPLLVYFVVRCYNTNKNKKYNDLILDITLISSLYLCLKFGCDASDTNVFLFCNIPIIIAYIKKKEKIAIVLSIINIIYYYFIFDILNITLIIKYISYYILYIIGMKKKLSINGFILSIAVLQAFFLSFEYFFVNISISVSGLIKIMIIIFSYYFITFSIVYIFKIIDKVESLNNTIKTLEKDKMIKDALFKLTHEIKNPLAVCKGYLDMFDINKKEKSEKYISIMRQEIDRSLNIMTDFVEFNKIKVIKNRFDLSILLEDVYDSFKILISNKNINLLYSNDKEIYVTGDYERLKQVIVNLVKNSLESIENQGKIEIYTENNNDKIEVIIKDNGSGMNKETLNQVKNMFFTTKSNGTGLGVALSNEIIKAHNGELIFNSREGYGTEAKIILPL